MGRIYRPLSIILMLIFICLLFEPLNAARIKELAYINGVRSNQLVGYGLVVGLNQTGDRQSTIFTTQTLTNMLEKMGIRVAPNATRVNNIAAVMVTADLPPFAKRGNKVDAVVSSIGDARSLEGGVLISTPLRGADGEIYAVAQGPLAVGGFLATGAAASVQKNHPTVGRIPNGVSIEREIGYQFVNNDSIVISLKNPDFTNVKRIEESINRIFHDAAQAKDGGTLQVFLPDEYTANPVKFLSIVENLEIAPDSVAKIVVDEKTGTIVIGENVRISTVAISHGNISIQIREEPRVTQPLPFTGGQTVVTPGTEMRVEEEKGHFFVVQGGVSIKELVGALNALGVSTRDTIIILQTIKAAGALHAELELI